MWRPAEVSVLRREVKERSESYLADIQLITAAVAHALVRAVFALLRTQSSLSYCLFNLGSSLYALSNSLCASASSPI
jgi:hypothetical protein